MPAPFLSLRKEEFKMATKIYYRQVRGDKYSMIYCSWCGKPGVSYNIIEMKENGISYKVGVNLSGQGYFCGLDCMQKAYPNAKIRGGKK